MEVYMDGITLLRLVLTNKGTAFSYEERVALGTDPVRFDPAPLIEAIASSTGLRTSVSTVSGAAPG